MVFRKLYPCFSYRDEKWNRAAVTIKANFGREAFAWAGAKSEGGSTNSERDLRAGPGGRGFRRRPTGSVEM